MAGEKADKIIAEIISTEETYNAALENLMENLINPLKMDKNLKGDSRVKKLIKFSEQIKPILEISKRMLKELLESKDKVGIEKQRHVANVFSKYAPFMKLYGSYLTTYSEMMNIVTKLGKENKNYQKIQETFLAKAESHGQNEMSHLIMPVQRVPRYVLLLKELSKNAEPDATKELMKTLHALEAAAGDINEQKRRAEKNEEIKNYYERLEPSNKKQAKIAKRIIFSPKEALKKGQPSFSLSNVVKKSGVLINRLNSDLSNFNSGLTKLNKNNMGGNVRTFQSLKSSDVLQVKAEMSDNKKYTFLLKKGKAGKFKITIKEDISKLSLEEIENLFKIAQKIGEEVCATLNLGVYKFESVDPFRDKRLSETVHPPISAPFPTASPSSTIASSTSSPVSPPASMSQSVTTSTPIKVPEPMPSKEASTVSFKKEALVSTRTSSASQPKASPSTLVQPPTAPSSTTTRPPTVSRASVPPSTTASTPISPSTTIVPPGSTVSPNILSPPLKSSEINILRARGEQFKCSENDIVSMSRDESIKKIFSNYNQQKESELDNAIKKFKKAHPTPPASVMATTPPPAKPPAPSSPSTVASSSVSRTSVFPPTTVSTLISHPTSAPTNIQSKQNMPPLPKAGSFRRTLIFSAPVHAPLRSTPKPSVDSKPETQPTQPIASNSDTQSVMRPLKLSELDMLRGVLKDLQCNEDKIKGKIDVMKDNTEIKTFLLNYLNENLQKDKTGPAYENLKNKIKSDLKPEDLGPEAQSSNPRPSYK